MNLRIRDHALYWFHRTLAGAGAIRAPSLEEIRTTNFRRVLVAATTAIGDAVLCAPLLDSLRAARPDVKIGFWVSSAAKPLFDGRPGLDCVIPYRGKYRGVRETMELLRRGQFDLALVANANDPDVIPMIWWSGCHRIVRRPQRHTIYSFMIANPEMLNRNHTTGHAIERNLQFCDLIGIPRGEARTRLAAAPETEKRIQERLRGCASPWWVLHPGASRSKKQWGVERFAELARRFLAVAPGSLVLTGSPEEKSVCEEIGRHLGKSDRVWNMAGALSIDELAALFKQARLLVSGDTGPYHIAMAVGAATVTLFAPWDIGSSPQINGPYFDLDRHLVVATNQIGDPITTLGVDRVWEACRPFLPGAAPRFSPHFF